MAILCLGEALVDLICERPVSSLAQADSFVPHFGGATANVAVAAARAGAAVQLAGGVGDDALGGWLRERLADVGVGLDWFELIKGAPTPLALVWVDDAGEASYQLYAQALGVAVTTIASRLDEALGACDALFFGTNSLASDPEREVTMAARGRALELGLPILFDPNLRMHRWPDSAAAAAAANACVEGALLVRMNRFESELLTGESDPERAASSLVQAGARCVVVTLGPEGALLRGEVQADVAAVPAAVLSTVGAGDAFTGVLLAALAAGDFDPRVLPAALDDAARAGAAATERWGAGE
ncbi:MAG: PfkB family carbohydrate kinase [Actinomycetota bacterium]